MGYRKWSLISHCRYLSTHLYSYDISVRSPLIKVENFYTPIVHANHKVSLAGGRLPPNAQSTSQRSQPPEGSCWRRTLPLQVPTTFPRISQCNRTVNLPIIERSLGSDSGTDVAPGVAAGAGSTFKTRRRRRPSPPAMPPCSVPSPLQAAALVAAGWRRWPNWRQRCGAWRRRGRAASCSRRRPTSQPHQTLRRARRGGEKQRDAAGRPGAIGRRRPCSAMLHLPLDWASGPS